MTSHDTLRVWVSSYGAYNDARYYLAHGEWFDLHEAAGMGPAEFVADGIKRGRITITPTPGTEGYEQIVRYWEMFHEELHVFDHDLPGIDIGEFDLGPTIDALVEFYDALDLERIDPALFGAWFAHSGNSGHPNAEHVSDFRDKYQGQAESPAAFAGEWRREWFDAAVAGVAHDLQAGLHGGKVTDAITSEYEQIFGYVDWDRVWGDLGMTAIYHDSAYHIVSG